MAMASLNMPRAASHRPTKKARKDPPRICQAIDTALNEAHSSDPRFTNNYIASLLGVSGAAVGRWRHISEPTRDQLAALETAIGRPLGYCLRLAGYAADFPDMNSLTLEHLIENDHRISDRYRRILLGFLELAIDESRAQRQSQT
jgi:hypothetical protein